MSTTPLAEQQRLDEDDVRSLNWKRWGPYLAERQWGTVREDYSADGDAWRYFPHEHARSRAYRWGEEGLLGICDRGARLCFALALWNERDPFLKERIFGLSNPEGNHGEDAKEAWYYLDATPTHSYLRGLYKYPQAAFPYERLRTENARRTRLEREYELHETGIFDDRRYFDVFAEYAKAAPEDILIRITLENRGAEPARLHVLPTLWFRNTWSWGQIHGRPKERPSLTLEDGHVWARHETLGDFRLSWETPAEVLFTENETNLEKLYGTRNQTPVVKDGLNDRVVHGRTDAVTHERGTKCAPWYVLTVPAQGSVVLRLRLTARALISPEPFRDFEQTFATRREECEAFYEARIANSLSRDQKNVVRQAYAGLIWSKQYYQYIASEWLRGDPGQPPPPKGHAEVRNFDWPHLHAAEVLSMPDKWEYPWFAAWDLAFHMIPMASVDGTFAKGQLELLLREWYMHPNGQIPAYEWNFSDVNPPVHAWACWRVYKISAKSCGGRDRPFLERCFQKLLLNFTWWVNRKDVQGRHVFSGGFLGLDNIGLFDRSKPLPGGQSLAQADGTAWMAFYCATMLSIALELAQENSAYEDIASKFFEHFVQIIDAINNVGEGGLWNEEDGFYYDQLLVEGTAVPLRVRSLVGIIPLLAVEVLDQRVIDRLPGFKKRLEWFLENVPHLAQYISCVRPGAHGHEQRLLAIASGQRLQRVLRYLLDEAEFLAQWGVRSLSRRYEQEPFCLHLDGTDYRLAYEPAESQTWLFGGNSNWRGPIWFPINYLLIEALERYHFFFGDSLQVEFPTGSGKQMTLGEVARQLSLRLSAIFTLNEHGRRPCFGDNFRYAEDPHWRDHMLFHEYFHAEIGCGLGANHQTGWTALITRCLGIVGRISPE